MNEEIKNDNDHLRFLESLDKVNRAIQGTVDLQQMLQDVLDAVISIFDCDRSYLLYPCDPETTTWKVPMERAKAEYPGANVLNTDIPVDDEVKETFRILRNSDRPVSFDSESRHPLPTAVAERFNIRSFVGMAIYPKIGKPWQFGMHQCSYARAWTPNEMQLFKVIGQRLSDAVSVLLGFQQLSEQREFLDKVVESIPNMIFVKDARDLCFIRINKAGEQLLGYSRQELLGKNDYDFFPKEEAEFFAAKDHEVLSQKKPLDIPEETIQTRLKGKRILHTQKIPILDEDGRPGYLLGISQDITDFKQVEESVHILTQAVEQSPVSIVITDVMGRIEFTNAQFAQITGYTLAEVLGQNLRFLKSGETSVAEYRRLWNTIRSGGVWRGEFHNRKKNGELFWESATIAPVRDANNVISHFIAVKEDITVRKKLEEQLRQSQKMEAVGQLAGGVAHDFNNMLSVILGYTEQILGSVAPSDPLHDNLNEIFKAAKRSAEITAQLLAFARKQTISPKVLDLNQTLESMLKMIQRLIGEDIDLSFQPMAGLWPIKVDSSQVDQILINLCINAREAITGVGNIIIETQNADFDDAYCAEHEGTFPGGYVMLAVSDNGNGMDKRTMDKIFEPFFTTKDVGKGTGLGLAMVYGIIKQNNGFINVYSEPGKGTTFKVYFPSCVGEAEKIRKKAISKIPSSKGETVLLVEDEPIILEMSQKMLEKLGYQVLATGTPGEALLLAEKHKGSIHLLITDVVMPEMTGLDLANQLHVLYPDIKTIFMSGYTSNVIAHRGVLAEGLNFLQKPFFIKDLAAKVREALDEE